MRPYQYPLTFRAKPTLPIFWKFRSGIGYVTFTVAFGLMVDLASYGLIVPVLPFRLTQAGYKHVPAQSSYLIAAYAAGLIISSIPFGILGEQFQARKLPLLLCLFFLASSLILFWRTTSFPVLIIARILQGFSGTGIWTLGLALICDTVPEAQVGTIMGYVMIGWSLGMITGPLLGGILYQSLGYDAVFIFGLSLTFADFVFRLLLLDRRDADRCRALSDIHSTPELPSKSKSKVEEPASANKTPLERSTQEAIIDTRPDEEQQQPFIEPTSLFPAQSKTSDQSENPTARAMLRLTRSARCLTLFGIIFVLGFAFGGLLDSGLTIFLHKRHGLSPNSAALVFVAAVFPSFVSSPFAGWLSNRYTAKWPVVGFLALGAPFFVLLGLQFRLYGFIIAIGFNGFFIMGVAAPLLEDLAQVVRQTPGLGYAHVYAIFNMVYSIGALVGPLCIGALLGELGIERGWVISCFICAPLTAVCIIPAWLFIGNRPNRSGIV